MVAMARSRSMRCGRLSAPLLALALLLVPVPTTNAAAPDTTGQHFDSLMARWSDIPDVKPGWRNFIDVVLGHTRWTENGSVTADWYNFEVWVGYININADGEWVDGWQGMYRPTLVPAPPVQFTGHAAFAQAQMTWQCGSAQPCPSMPDGVTITVAAEAVGAPLAGTATDASSRGPNPDVSQQFNAVVSLDMGTEMTVPAFQYAVLARGSNHTILGAPYAHEATNVRFPNTTVGQTSHARTTFTNRSGTDVTIGAVHWDMGVPEDFDITWNGTCRETYNYVIPDGRSCTIEMTFTPAAPGHFSTTLSVLGDPASIVLDTLRLSGNGV